MGVRGLTTFINCNQNAFLQTYQLHDSPLVIDGHSLCAQLYRTLNCFSAFGGDYDKFWSYTRNFFKGLRKCNITPYVIFDGSYEHRKLRTAYSRLRSKINGASRLDPVTQGCLQIFPLLIRDAFIEALVEMNVPYTVCEFEADDEIAALARHLSCPVLSYDSDFFIYNVLYIPFNTLDFKPTPVDENGNRVFVLECKIYRVEHLTTHLGGLKEELLPLLATLLGNDYVEKQVFKKFFSQLKLPKGKKNRNEQQRCIHGLFKWLQNETLDSAITKILGRLKKNQKEKVFALIKKSIDGYNSKHCRSLHYFNIKENNVSSNIVFKVLENIDIENTEDKDCEETSDGEDDSSKDDDVSSVEGENYEEDQFVLGVPEWFSEGIRLNRVPKNIINLYTHHLYFCSPQAEDYNDTDSALCTLPILRYAFDILTDFSHEYCTYVSRENDSNYRRIAVNEEYATSQPLQKSYQDLSDHELRSYFYHFLKQKLPLLNLDVVSALPANFQLIMISLIWWVSNCEVPLGHIHSVIMSYVMLEVIDEKTGTFRGHNHFNNKFSKKIEALKRNPSENQIDITESFLNKNKVQYEDCLIAAHSLLRLFELDDKIKKKPKSYDVRKMHSFAQFQCCLLQFNSLNVLCRCPFESTKYSKSFNGTFIYNMSVKLENQTEPVSFLEQYLKGATTVLLFYKNLCKIYDKCAEVMSLENVKWTGKKKRKRRKNAGGVEETDINFIVKGFESEVFI